jgi:hypothetical protein
MSHSLGALKFKDGTIRYYEYNGTSDIVISCHYETVQEVLDNWRSYKRNDCKCNNEEDVSIYTSYGNGFYIDGKACKICNSVRPNDCDFDIIEKDDTYDWAKSLSSI